MGELFSTLVLETREIFRAGVEHHLEVGREQHRGSATRALQVAQEILLSFNGMASQVKRSPSRCNTGSPRIA